MNQIAQTQKNSHVCLPWYRSLYAKLCLSQLVLLLVLGSFVILLLLRFSRSFLLESDQLLNWGLASELSSAVSPLVTDGIDYIGLEKRFFEIATLHPRIRLFLVDNEGQILASSIGRSEIHRNRISLSPLREVLSAQYATKTPILGDDPATADSKSIFSVAHISLKQNPGFLYVLIDSGRNNVVTDVLESSYITRSSIVLLLVFFALIWVVGVLAFSFLTKPLTKMTAAVRLLAVGDYSMRVEYQHDDELGVLANAYNAMADTLTETLQKLENTDKLRRELVANVAHDLRGPLTVAYGYLETISLKDVTLSDTAKDKAIDAATRNIRSLCRLVDSLFELAAIEARDSAPQMKPIELADFFETLVLRFEQLASESGISIHATTPAVAYSLIGDPGLLERAISNLIDNAIKYTPRGREVHLLAVAEGNTARIEVADTGDGISKEDLARIFDSFYRSAATAESTSGTGLGLAIARRIVKLHSSELLVESTVGVGTRFYFSLAAAPAKSHPLASNV